MKKMVSMMRQIRHTEVIEVEVGAEAETLTTRGGEEDSGPEQVRRMSRADVAEGRQI